MGMHGYLKYWLGVGLLALLLLSWQVFIATAQDTDPHAEMDHSSHNSKHWYDNDCCHERDCAPAILFLQNKADLTEFAKTKHGEVVITQDFPVTKRRESKDHQVHVCMRAASDDEKVSMPHKTTTGMIAICVYYPGGS